MTLTEKPTLPLYQVTLAGLRNVSLLHFQNILLMVILRGFPIEVVVTIATRGIVVILKHLAMSILEAY